jgi:hypothetical protein
MEMKRSLVLILLLLMGAASPAQEHWQLKKESDGIKIYTASKPNSNVKAIKVAYTLAATPSQLVALLLDIPSQTQWVYSTKLSYIIKKVADNELIYYTEKSMPWPASNRDVVMKLTISQHPATNIVTVHSTTVDGYMPPKPGIVRVPSSNVVWTVTPIDHDHIKIDYEAEADPGGSVPAFIVNMFLAKGPYETFKKLQAMVDRPAYKNASFSFIKNQ